MAKTDSKSRKSKKKPRHCALPQTPPRELPANINPNRARLIRNNDLKWANGTVLRYFFFNRSTTGPGRKWGGAADQQDVVRDAFKAWKDLGIGLRFVEVDDASDAEVRIGFYRGDDPFDGGSWSWVGREVIDKEEDPDRATMNFGWDITDDYGWDTALHEIGHTLGFPHEHQNPNAGIEWNEDKVYAYYKKSDGWCKEDTYYNILRKLDPTDVSGSDWDPNSIMHYDFAKGLIAKPDRYRDGLSPDPGLSPRDIETALRFYPPIPDEEPPELSPFQSMRLEVAEGEQANFIVRPRRTRTYTIQTMGESDANIALFQKGEDEPFFVAGDDDGAEDRNATLSAKLYRGVDYVLRVRLIYARRAGEVAVMMT